MYDFTAFHFFFAIFNLILDAPRTYVNVSAVFKSVLRIRTQLGQSTLIRKPSPDLGRKVPSGPEKGNKERFFSY
jgi:hypothetical protein